MTTDIVERLRCQYASGPMIDGKPEFGYRDTSGPMMVTLPTPIMREAADEIERLQIERDSYGKRLADCENGYQTLEREVAELRENGDRLLAVADSAVAHQRDMIDAVAEPLRDTIDKLRVALDAALADAQRYRALYGKLS